MTALAAGLELEHDADTCPTCAIAVQHLRAARDELYHLRVVVNGLRNRVKTDAATIVDSERRIETQLDAIEKVLDHLTPKGGPR